jgi:hypothetical protein
MPMVRIFGASLLDDYFTLTTPGLEEITWNVTKLQKAAEAGAFGDAIEMPMAIMPAPRYDLGNLERDKVDAFKYRPDILERPAIAIASAPERLLCFCDGQHRLTARYELKLETFLTFVVPETVERQFRITEVRS